MGNSMIRVYAEYIRDRDIPNPEWDDVESVVGEGCCYKGDIFHLKKRWKWEQWMVYVCVIYIDIYLCVCVYILYKNGRSTEKFNWRTNSAFQKALFLVPGSSTLTMLTS